ncbi:MAG: hypothetical protein MUF64_14035 [Polyangiaceae bacterium]|jgi:hypothetical protein|nr:hypothetical protein [Polyangiaceae bacterium]
MEPGAWKTPGVLRGFASGGERVVALVWLSEDGGHIFSCRYHPAQGFRWVQREDLDERGGYQAGEALDGVPLERTPLKPVLEELAHAVVAHQRAGAPLPAELQLLVALLTPGEAGALI